MQMKTNYCHSLETGHPHYPWQLLEILPKVPIFIHFCQQTCRIGNPIDHPSSTPTFPRLHLIQPALALIEVRQGRLGKVAQTQLFLGAICAGGDHAPPTRALHQVTPGDQLIPAACEIPMGFSIFESQLMLLKSLAATCSIHAEKNSPKKIDPFPIVSIILAYHVFNPIPIILMKAITAILTASTIELYQYNIWNNIWKFPHVFTEETIVVCPASGSPHWMQLVNPSMAWDSSIRGLTHQWPLALLID